MPPNKTKREIARGEGRGEQRNKLNESKKIARYTFQKMVIKILKELE